MASAGRALALVLHTNAELDAQLTRVARVQHAILGVEVDAGGQVARRAKVNHLDLQEEGKQDGLSLNSQPPAGVDVPALFGSDQGSQQAVCPAAAETRLAIHSDQNVLGLDVAVHDAQGVQPVQRWKRTRGTGLGVAWGGLGWPEVVWGAQVGSAALAHKESKLL